MTIQEIVELIQAVSDNGLTSLVYEEGDQKLVLEKKEKKCVPLQQPVAPLVISQPAPSLVSPMAVTSQVAAESSEPKIQTEEAKTEESVEIGSDNVVVSPLVGTFYSASSPDAEPFVKVGDTVKKGQVLGIIEAMKLMNEIESDFDGVVEAVLVQNEDVVEYGQPLFRIR